MPCVFFKIGAADLTPWTDVQTYAVNAEDVFEEWEDGNHVTHRQISRVRYAGALQLGFADPEVFSAFTALLQSAKSSGGWYPVTAYISNTGAMASFDAFLDVVNDEDKWDAVNGRQWLVASVTVTQR